MTTQGDVVLRDLVVKDIARIENGEDASPCTRCGMLTLLKCQLAEMDGAPAMSGGKVTAISGVITAVVVGVAEALRGWLTK